MLQIRQEKMWFCRSSEARSNTWVEGVRHEMVVVQHMAQRQTNEGGQVELQQWKKKR